MSNTVWRFERFEVQTRERRLLVDGAPTSLGARAFDMLTVMIERAGHLVTKSELLDLVWPGLVVEENNVAAQIVALRKVLGGDLIATVPGHGYRFNGRPEKLGATPPLGAASASIPGSASGPQLFGREYDLLRLQKALQEPGCISLIGPGGVGKTALAKALVDRYEATQDLPLAEPGAPLWLDLAALSEGAQLLPALARALGLRVPDKDVASALATALGEHRLLVLDNAEHLLDATATLLAQLLPAAPTLHVLVTSQAPLGLPQGRLQPLAPLSIAGEDAAPELALRSDAIGLLVARACAADYRLRLGPEQLPLLRALCSELDGLPLAIEMAAARVPLLGLQGVHDALAERFSLLKRNQRGSASRHPTLYAALDWSYSLLAPSEQALFRQLGVFMGGFTLELMLAVTQGPGLDRWDLIDQLAALVDRSLVVTLPGEAGEAPRYRLLETMHAFALEQLRACDEEAAVMGRYAQALNTFLHSTLANKDRCIGEDHKRLIENGLAEMDNARKAWHWAIEHEVACAVGISAAASGIVPTTAWRPEVNEWLFACEPHLNDGVPLATQALWWKEFAQQVVVRRDKRATEVAQRACEMAQAVGDELLQVWSQMNLARSFVTPDPQAHQACDVVQDLVARHPEWPDRVRLNATGTRALVAYYEQDFPLALRCFQEEQAIAERLQLRDAVAVAESNVIALLQALDRKEECVAAIHAALGRMGNRHSIASTYMRINLIEALLALGRVAEATQATEETLQLARRFDAMHIAGEVFAKLALRQGRPRAAATLLGFWLGYCARRNAVPNRDAASQQFEAELRSALGDATSQQMITTGDHLNDMQADQLLLSPDEA